MKLYKYIGQGAMTEIESYITSGGQIDHYSFLTLMDKLSKNTKLLELFKDKNAILEYDQLFIPVHDHDALARVYHGIKLLLVAWKEGTIFNSDLLARLNLEAENRISEYWKINPTNHDSLSSYIDLEINDYIERKSNSWFRDCIEPDELQKINKELGETLFCKLKRPSRNIRDDFLKATFKNHYNKEIIEFYKKNKLDDNIQLDIYSRLRNECSKTQKSHLKIKLHSFSFDEILCDWKSNLLSITCAEEFEDHFLEIVESTMLTDDFSHSISVSTISNLLKRFKKKELDILIIRHLSDFLKDSLKVILYNEILLDKSMKTLCIIVRSVIQKWKKNEFELSPQFTLEKICFPSLYRLKKEYKAKSTEGNNALSMDRKPLIMSDREAGQLRSTIANIPLLVRHLVRYHMLNPDKVSESTADVETGAIGAAHNDGGMTSVKK